ncbi:hypothetical protein CDAR_226451 [Caerostris darwini]|uniref:Uncharacterized protein n=1 Tax=Caerostris darwini TaxID=1538125 RepID=A0AAV4Q0C4_9ARAC|nr:hypothetical protein CDAR_226451 [Caerostris darwini]
MIHLPFCLAGKLKTSLALMRCFIRIRESISFCSQEKCRPFLKWVSFADDATLLLSASQQGPTRLRQSQQLRQPKHHWRWSFTDKQHTLRS